MFSQGVEVEAGEYEQIDIHMVKSVEELNEYLDNSIFLEIRGDGSNKQEYEKLWEITVNEPGWIVLNKYYLKSNYSADPWNSPSFINDFMYKNILLTNSVSKNHDRNKIDSSGFSYKEITRYYVTPGTYYFQLKGTLYSDDHDIYSLAMLQSKALLDIDSITYTENYDTATVKFKSMMDNAIQLQILNREYVFKEKFFEDSLNQIEKYDSYSKEEVRKVRVKEILNEGLELKENGTYSLLIQFADDDYSKFPVSVSFSIDKIGSEPEVVEAKSIKINKTKATLNVGKTVKLSVTLKPKNVTDKTITWKSSNKKVTTVDKNGKVTAKKKGTCTITAITSNGKKAKCKITVKK